MSAADQQQRHKEKTQLPVEKIYSPEDYFSGKSNVARLVLEIPQLTWHGKVSLHKLIHALGDRRMWEKPDFSCQLARHLIMMIIVSRLLINRCTVYLYN